MFLTKQRKSGLIKSIYIKKPKKAVIKISQLKTKFYKVNTTENVESYKKKKKIVMIPATNKVK